MLNTRGIIFVIIGGLWGFFTHQVVASAAITPSFHLQSLGNLGGWSSTAAAINNQNEIVGYFWDNNNNCSVFTWQQSLGMSNLNIPVNNARSSLIINQIGSIAGNVIPSTASPNQGQAFLWKPSSGLIELNILNLWIDGFNNADHAVGYTSDNTGYHSFIIDSSMNLQQITIPGYLNIRALNNNNQDQVLIQAKNSITHHIDTILLNANETVFPIYSSVIGNCAAKYVNDNGDVVGTIDNIDTGARHAFTWNQTTGMHELYMGDLGFANPFMINNLGQVIGQDENINTGQIVWTLCQDGQAYDISQLIDSSGSGWSDFEISAINDNGIIVGNATYDGQYYTVLLTPNDPIPEPASLSLLALGSFLLLHRRK